MELQSATLTVVAPINILSSKAPTPGESPADSGYESSPSASLPSPEVPLLLLSQHSSRHSNSSQHSTSPPHTHHAHQGSKSERRKSRSQANQAKRLARFHHTAPLVDIGSPLLEDEDDRDPIPLSVMPRNWLFEEDASFADDALISFPKREWVYDARGPQSMDAKSFGVISWNLLSPRLCSPMRLDITCEPAFLEWSHRKETIVNQLAFMDADIVCLQEIELKDYEEYFCPRMARLGYRSIHAYKMNMYEMRDGCAIFYRDSRFKLLREDVLRFNQIELDDGQEKRPSMARDTAIRFNLFHNLALVALLENKRTKKCVQVATTHLLADPTFPDAKLLQTAILTSKLEELKALAISEATNHRQQQSQQQHQHFLSQSKGRNQDQPTGMAAPIPTILTGDLNSLPDSPVVDFLKSGRVETRHFGENDFGRFTRADNPYFHHGLGFADSYETSSLPFTNATRHFQGTIDYVLYDPSSLGLVGYLDHFEAELDLRSDDDQDMAYASPISFLAGSDRSDGGSSRASAGSMGSRGSHKKQVAEGRISAKKAPYDTDSDHGTECSTKQQSPRHPGHEPRANKKPSRQRAFLPKALPSQHFPSDHIPLVAIFRERESALKIASD